jgi:hypothetical protein
MSFANVSWIDSKHLFLHGRFVLGKDYLLDLENRALVCQYDDGVECTLHETGRLDGTMWLETRNSRLAANNFKLRDFTFSLPSNPPRLEDHASLHPGEGVSVSVASSVIDQAILYAEVTQTLRDRGFKVDRKASRRFRLSVEPKTIREARLNSGRTFSVQTFVFHWTFFDAAGVKIWEQLSPMPWTSYVVGNSAVSNEQEAQEKMKEQFRKTARTMTMPRYVFPKVEALNLPVRKYSE